jgi:YqjK-like protein
LSVGRIDLLEQRRQALLIRSTALRGQLAQDVGAFEGVGQLADAGWAAWRWVRCHPLPVVSAVAALAVWRPRRVLRVAGAAWRWWRRLEPVWRTVSVLLQARR